MRGIKRVLRKFSPGERSRQEKRYGGMKSLVPNVSTITLQKRDNPKTPTMKLPTYIPGEGERMAQGVLRREREVKPRTRQGKTYTKY